MSTSESRTIDSSGVNETAFEPNEDVRLAGPLASLAWFAVALLLVLAPNVISHEWRYIAATAAAITGCVIASVDLASSWSPLARRLLSLAPWLLALAAFVDVWLIFSHFHGTIGW